MTSFSKYLLGKKLSGLNSTQESIETLSLWLLHHRKYAATIVKYWSVEFVTASEQQKIILLFLANEIFKAPIRKSYAFWDEFKKVLPETFEHIGKCFVNRNLIERGSRLLHIWRSTGVLSEELFENLKKCLKKTSPTTTANESDDESDDDETYNIRHVFLSFKAPSSKDLINALEELHTPASADQKVRDEIASFPKKLFETKTLYALDDTQEAAKYAEKLQQIQVIVENFNERLESELEQRNQLYDMLLAFKESELERIAEIEEKLKGVENDLQVTVNMREELERHRQSLPDLKELSEATELPPLPSLLELFKKSNE